MQATNQVDTYVFEHVRAIHGFGRVRGQLGLGSRQETLGPKAEQIARAFPKICMSL